LHLGGQVYTLHHHQLGGEDPGIMKCVHCNDEAEAICRWCGRAVCGNHIKSMTYIISVYVGGKKVPKSLVVADAVWCGVCKPQPEPIEMPYLD
jgi:hypothetical protein